MSSESDRQHIKAILTGDKEAFRYFITNYQEMAVRVAFSMVQDEGIAKQVVQSAFIQAFKSLPTFRQEAQFSTWLYRIVVNESIKLNRQRKTDQRTVPISAEHTISLHTHNGAIETMALKEKKQEINRALALMKPKERLILELYYLQENSIAEINIITGFSVSNVKVLLHRARKNFASFFRSAN